MAQKDIEEIAEQMRLAEEAARACDEAYEKACEEEKAFEAAEFEELEDEIIDPATMGFVDAEQLNEDSLTPEQWDEAAAWFNANGYPIEDDDIRAEEEFGVSMDQFLFKRGCSPTGKDEVVSGTDAWQLYQDLKEASANDSNLEEDVSDCLQEKEPVDEAEDQGSIEVEVFNEDGFGKHFAAEVMKNVPGVAAAAKKNALPNGDIVVKISGARPDLEKAFAFYVGQKDYNALPREDKEEFESLLVFDDGDTLAEADYREAVAHCLDPIGINASTADLIAQDTCAINLIREEKMRRKAKKMAKALCENDFSSLSDEDLEKLEGIQNALASAEGADGMTDDERRVWDTMLGILGYTQEEWDKLTPEQQDKAFRANADLSKQLSKTGFAHWQTKVDPKTGKTIRYQDQYQVFDPETGDHSVTAFNPGYGSEDSMYQHPKAFRRKQQKDVEKLDAQRREELSKQAMKRVRGQSTWNINDWAQMLTSLTSKQRAQLMDEMIAEIQDEAIDKQQAANEVMVIKKMFGQDPTMRDLGASWGKAHTVVKKLADDVEAAFHVAMRKTTGNQAFSRSDFNKIVENPALRERFIKVFNNELNAKKAGKNPVDPERSMKHSDWLKMLKDLGYNPARWDKLSTDEQLKLMDQYYASKNVEQK